MKRALLCLALVVSIFAQTRMTTPAWISGDGTKHAFDANTIALTVDVYALGTNSATNCSTSDYSKCPIIGDTNIVQGSRGFPLLPGANYHFEMRPQGQPGYSLPDLYYIISTGDKLSIVWTK